jgi:hypothetical protein
MAKKAYHIGRRSYSVTFLISGLPITAVTTQRLSPGIANCSARPEKKLSLWQSMQQSGTFAASSNAYS